MMSLCSMGVLIHVRYSSRCRDECSQFPVGSVNGRGEFDFSWYFLCCYLNDKSLSSSSASLLHGQSIFHVLPLRNLVIQHGDTKMAGSCFGLSSLKKQACFETIECKKRKQYESKVAASQIVFL